MSNPRPVVTFHSVHIKFYNFDFGYFFQLLIILVWHVLENNRSGPRLLKDCPCLIDPLSSCSTVSVWVKRGRCTRAEDGTFRAPMHLDTTIEAPASVSSVISWVSSECIKYAHTLHWCEFLLASYPNRLDTGKEVPVFSKPRAQG